MARRVGVSHVTVMRVWHKAGLQPHRPWRYVASPDPDFEAKPKDILGLYLYPSDKAVVLCVDEKTQALGSHPTGLATALSQAGTAQCGVRAVRDGIFPGRLAGPYGQVQSRCVARHTSEEFVWFLDEAVVGQRRKQIHPILDGLSVHKTAAVRAWLRHHPQVHHQPSEKES